MNDNASGKVDTDITRLRRRHRGRQDRSSVVVCLIPTMTMSSSLFFLLPLRHSLPKEDDVIYA
jgi:hypothetical protein